jgi:signal transduction histidine kinase
MSSREMSIPGRATQVLLVEDNPGDADLVRDYLLESSMDAEIAHESRLSGACSRLAQGGFDVILLDLGLPDAEGFEALDGIRSVADRYAIVVLTGLSDEDAAIGALQRGAQDYLLKTELTPSLLSKSIRHSIERQQLEHQLREAQKMEAIGRLAGGIAHDFNNLLMAIIGYSECALEALEEGNPVRNDIREVVAAGERAQGLTRQLLAFSRRQMLRPKALDLNAAMQGLYRLLRRTIGEDIDLVMNLGTDLDPVLFDPSQIDQIVLNLAVNARDAMPSGGRLTIETGNVDLDEHARGHADADPGPHVLLSVSDTGTGMDVATSSRVFEPFFTTKSPGKGTGLGLSTVYGIVRQGRGSIWLDTELGRGTTFKVYLPRADSASVASPTTDVRVPSSSAKATILVAEDEDVVRRLIVRVLEQAGYTVLSAGDAEGALDLFDRQGGGIDLLLTDVVLPKMSGRDLAERLLVVEPTLKVLYMSGYTDDAIVHHGVLDPTVAFMEKPISPTLLAAKIGEMISGSPA